MRNRTCLAIVFAIVTLSLVSTNQSARAQTGPTQPTGGGWMREVRSEGGVVLSQTKGTIWWLYFGPARFTTYNRTTVAWDRSWVRVPQRVWIGSKIIR